MLADGYTDVPTGKIALAVTHLEMLEPRERALSSDARGATGSGEASPAVRIRAVQTPDPSWYRNLFQRIGAPWLWLSRLVLDEAALRAIIQDPAVAIFALEGDGRDEGLIELDFRIAGQCELAFFGLTPGQIGKGAGRAMMDRAKAEAWARPIERFWVHTCTGDHPDALAFYRRSGFEPFRMQVEVIDDPRLTGLLPETAAPHVPLIRPKGR